ncbi:hypothetical protein ALON55S_07505 [Alishewanella longhuensis]
MRTGEGKTLTATLPAYLNALGGKLSMLLLLTITWPSAMRKLTSRYLAFWV